jgi:hypothetical protein
MKTLDWLRQEIMANGLLCEEYAERVRNAKSKKQLFEICCDANGVSFLPEMTAKGYSLDYELIWAEFDRYINGKYKPEFESPLTGDSYTSAIYCQYNDVKDIVVDTTLSCFLACDNEVWIRPFNIARICVDANCHLKIHCPQSSSLVVEYWGDDDMIEIAEGEDRIRVRKRY